MPGVFLLLSFTSEDEMESQQPAAGGHNLIYQNSWEKVIRSSGPVAYHVQLSVREMSKFDCMNLLAKVFPSTPSIYLTAYFLQEDQTRDEMGHSTGDSTLRTTSRTTGMT